MKKTTIAILTLLLLALPLTASADTAAALFDAKCKACHGADGKKLAKADLTADSVQARPEAELLKFLTTDAKHKSKVADAAAAKTLVTYLKTLKK